MMKLVNFVEYQGKKTSVKELEDKFKDMWKEKGGKIKDLGEVEFYIKPDEKACYYFVRDTHETGKIHF